MSSRSDVVLVGRVRHLDASPSGPGGRVGIHTRVDVEVERVLVGSPRVVESIWIQGGVVGDRARVLPQQARFERDERVLVFLFEAPDGTLWPTGMAAGRWIDASLRASSRSRCDFVSSVDTAGCVRLDQLAGAR